MSLAANSTHPSLERLDFGRVSVFFGAKSGKYPDGNQVLIRGSDSLAAFDTPLVSNHIGAEFEATELVLMGHIHEDHMAGLHRLPQAKVFVHEADLQAARSWSGLMASVGLEDGDLSAQVLAKFQKEFFYAPRPDAQGYADGMVWDLGQTRVRAFHMPGHTAGHTVLLIEPEGIAFIGDIDLTGFGPYYGDASSSLSDFRQSLKRLPEIPASTWVTSHHRGVYTDRQRFLHDLSAFEAKIDEREQSLLQRIGESPKSLEQLIDLGLLYPPGYQSLWTRNIEARSIEQHLAELLQQQRIACDEQGRYSKL